MTDSQIFKIIVTIITGIFGFIGLSGALTRGDDDTNWGCLFIFISVMVIILIWI